MHPFFVMSGLMHATAIAVIGFFVLFAASRSHGWLRTVGNVLGAWLFLIAAGALVFSAFAGSFGAGRLGARYPGFGIMGGCGMMGYQCPPAGPWGQPAQPPQGAPPAAASNK